MRYLDEDIIVTISNLTVSTQGVYNYDITLNGNTIFYGGVFLQVNQRTVDIDITDIIKNYKYKDEYINKLSDINSSLVIHNIIENVIVRLYIGNGVFAAGEEVAFIYRYPHYIKGMNYDLSLDTFSDKILLQGWEQYTETLKLVPHIPFVKSDNFSFGLVEYLYDEDFDRKLLFRGGLMKDDMVINYNSDYLPYYSLQSFKLSTLFNNIQVPDDSGKIHQECMHKMAEFYGGESVEKSNSADIYKIYDINSRGAIYAIELCDIDLNILSTKRFIPSITEGDFTYTFNGNIHIEYIKIGLANSTTKYVLLNVGRLFKQTDAEFTIKFTNRLLRQSASLQSLEIKDISIDCYSKYNIRELGYPMFYVEFLNWSSGVTVNQSEYKFDISFGDCDGLGFAIQNTDLPQDQFFNIIKASVGTKMYYKLGFKNNQTMIRCNAYQGTDKTSGNWLIFKETHNNNTFIVLDSYVVEDESDDVQHYNLNNCFKAYNFYEVDNSKDYSIYYLGFEDEATKIADVDICPAKYYLKWSDRYIGWQVQGFDGKSTYKENFNTTNIQTYNGISHPINISITPSWEINTKWIDEDLYPHYESIFVSEKLVLYDVENDKSYDVIITDKTFTEKTFKNTKKQFNLTLNLQMSKNQNIIY